MAEKRRVKNAFITSIIYFKKGSSMKKWSWGLYLKGSAMGVADIIPGVSGGTIALLVGIYDQLLKVVSEIGPEVLGLVRRKQWKQIIQLPSLHFLINLMAGILTSLMIFSHVVHYCLNHYPQHTWGFFFGLIAASVVVLMYDLNHQKGFHYLRESVFLLLGILIAYLVIGLVPVETPQTWWFVFIAGGIGICAMILPGISGSFLLLIMGQYEFITGMIKNPFQAKSIFYLTFFNLGCLVGLLSFSRVLKKILARYHHATMALLIGFIFGSLRKVWPWKEVTASKMIRGKLKVISEVNILPWEPRFPMDQLVSVMIVAVAGAICVLMMELKFHPKR
jgi:putative membrane protein